MLGLGSVLEGLENCVQDSWHVKGCGKIENGGQTETFGKKGQRVHGTGLTRITL